MGNRKDRANLYFTLHWLEFISATVEKKLDNEIARIDQFV